MRYTRRSFLHGAAGAVLGFPAIVRSQSQAPQATSGLQCGDVTADRAVIWSRSDRECRMVVEYSTTESFRDPRRRSTQVLAANDFTASIDLSGLRRGQTYSYRVSFEAGGRLRGEPLTGRFRTPGPARSDVRFLFSGDTVGQGWGIHPDSGGLRIYRAMADLRPDFFIHSGDQIYADGPLVEDVRLDDGSVWKNIVTPEKSKVAETLGEFRGNFRYNLMDEHARRFNAEVPMIAQWDDHEVRNNWYPGQILDDPRYQEKRVDVLAERARRAMFDYIPIRRTSAEPGRIYRVLHFGPSVDVFVLDARSYRGANSPNDQDTAGSASALLGRAQVDWLKRSLASSTATWKVIANDLPIGVIVPDAPVNGRPSFEAFANGDGRVLGREFEIADILTFIRRNRIRNTVWVTADVHYAAAHLYQPARAQFQDFDPFWEFVAGPMHAGTFGPNALDNTFGPELKFLAIPQGMKPNRPPSDGFQFFGMGAIDGRTDQLTVSIHDVRGEKLWSITLDPG